MSAAGPMRTCAEIAPLLVFYACDEVSAQERVAIEAHLAACEDCRGSSRGKRFPGDGGSDAAGR